MDSDDSVIRVPYQQIPTSSGTKLPVPLVSIGLSHGPVLFKRSFEALVDSGADDCVFPTSTARDLGIDLLEARTERRRGVGGSEQVFIHAVNLHFGPYVINIDACFMEHLPISGLLGRRGFFEHFRITFDPAGSTPGMEFERVFRS
ncbi:MAG: retropepsin-like aspartic protease [Acidobacteriaceae bacterium]